MAKLSEEVRAHLRLFAFYLANGTLCLDVLDGFDYSSLLQWGSSLEQVVAIWSNVLEVDESGSVLNEDEAARRAAQYIRSMVDPNYIVEPPFQAWEIELHL